MKILTLLFIFFVIFGFSIKSDGCKKGKISYSLPTYKDEFFIKQEYQTLFDSIFSDSVSKCFCKEVIKNIPSISKSKRKRRLKKEHHTIAPLFINLSNFDGFYAKRIFKKKSVNARFRCGYIHIPFIISNNEHFYLTDDTTKNKELIQSKLKTSFTKSELKRIEEYHKYHIICSSYTFLPPIFIKKNNEIIFDANKK